MMTIRQFALIFAIACGVGFIWTKYAHARDNGQWENEDPSLRSWYQSLKQPDNHLVSCCGEADAYEADIYGMDGDKMVATITNSRGNPIPEGTKIEIPPNKISRDYNPTGHVIVFIGGVAGAPYVYCFVMGSGV